MSTVPTRPNSKAPVDEETCLIIEHRLATADQEPKQDAREALEENSSQTSPPVTTVRRVEVSASAKADIDRATVWYENQKEELGDRFLNAVLDTIDRIALNPQGYSKVVR